MARLPRVVELSEVGSECRQGVRVDHLGLDHLDFMHRVGVDSGHVLVDAEAGATDQYRPAKQRDRTTQAAISDLRRLWDGWLFLEPAFLLILIFIQGLFTLSFLFS